jgi:hypothetical protein
MMAVPKNQFTIYNALEWVRVVLTLTSIVFQFGFPDFDFDWWW